MIKGDKRKIKTFELFDPIQKGFKGYLLTTIFLLCS